MLPKSKSLSKLSIVICLYQGEGKGLGESAWVIVGRIEEVETNQPWYAYLINDC